MPDEKLPVISLAEITQWRQKIKSAMLPYIGRVATTAVLKQIATDVVSTAQAKPMADNLAAAGNVLMATAVLDTMLGELAGVEITDAGIQSMSSRIAGNISRIKAGITIHPWKSNPVDEWCAVTVLDTLPHVTQVKRIPGSILTMSVLSGYASGHKLSQFFSNIQLGYLRRELGFPARQWRGRAPRELVKFKFVVKLAAGSDLRILEWRSKSSMNAINKALIAARDPDNRKCPEGFEWRCHACHRGFLTCQLGTHREDYVTRSCKNGHAGYFPEHDARPYCLQCENKMGG